MSRAKLFNMIKSRGEQKLGRNPMDLTNRHVYTQKVAKIVPVKALHTIPDDYFEVEMQEFSQNNIPMNTAAFLTGKKELLAYFVPYNTIWHNYNQYQATREDPESSALKVKGISYEPRISLDILYKSGLYFAIGAWIIEEFSKLGAVNLWWQMGSENLSHIRYFNEYGEAGNVTDVITFLKNNHYNADGMSDWEYFTRVSARNFMNQKFADVVDSLPFDVSFNCYEHYVEHSSTLTYGQTVTNMFGTPIWCDWCQKLDMLGYGNIYPILRIMRNYLDRIVSNELDSSPFAVTRSGIFATFDVGGVERQVSFSTYVNSLFSADSSREFMIAGFGDSVYQAISKLDAFTKVNQSGDATGEEYVNVYPLYAYNKCFYDYMRNVYYDTDYSVYNYNVDFVDCRDWESSIIYQGYIPCRFYHLECHQWKKDMFTGVLPDNQLGAVSQVSINIPSLEIQGGTDSPDYVSVLSHPTRAYAADESPFSFVNSYVEGGALKTTEGNEVQLRTEHTHSLSVGSSTYASQASFDVLALKRAEALQEYAQDLMRAGNRTQDIFNQIYGVTPKSQLDETPYFIDVASQDLEINPIIATASTGNENNGKLGDIAARALVKGDSLKFQFSTKDFGCVLLLSYIVPDSMYNSYRLDPHITHLDPESHCLPYFQNLGLQPVIGEFLNNLQPIEIRSRVCGYAPPYLEFKTDIDLVHGNLVDTFLPKVSESDTDAEYQGELSHWVVARTDMQQEQTVSLRNFYIDPRIVNNVFQFEAGSDYSTDHFLTYSVIKVNAVRALSDLGLPRF